MRRSWEDLSEQEKIEDLRRDVKRLFEAIDWTKSDIGSLRSYLVEIGEKIKGLS